MGKRWTAEEDKFLEPRYGRVPTREIAKKLGRSPEAVQVRAAALGLKIPSIEFDCASCGRHVITEGYRADGRPDMRKRFCSAACEKKYWRHPPSDRSGSCYTFQSLSQAESWEKRTNGKTVKERGRAKEKITEFKVRTPIIEFNCANCGRHVVTEGCHENGRPDMRTRYCCRECHNRYSARPRNRGSFASLQSYLAWERLTNE